MAKDSRPLSSSAGAPPSSETNAVREAAKIYFLPNLLTAGNLFFGFLAIIRCIQAKYAAADVEQSTLLYTEAVWFILFACVCDALDGRVARMGGRQSLFGAEFDSIADTVSFGVAPALMVFFLILSPTDAYPFFRQIGWLIGFAYLLCAGVRLARFNVLTNPYIPGARTNAKTSDFQGLPAPAAAAMIASLVLALNSLDLQNLTLILPVLMVLISWLMVSTIPYPSFKHIDWETQTRFRTFVMVIVIVLVIFLLKEVAFALVCLGYIFYGLGRHLRRVCTLRRLLRRRPKNHNQSSSE